ncbi:MAG: hypothetical protein JXR77_19395 [Lentisphaeria bacterium]|nr:hypothetical protein [Lentisphaeria bacterium]
MEHDFATLLQRLVRGDVAFVVIGGIACALNGFVRATEDVDILVDTQPANIRRLLAVLGEWGDGYARELAPEDFAPEPGAVRLVEDFPLDIFTILEQRTYRDWLPESLVSPDGIRYLGPRGLILSKQHTHREKDQIDVMALRRLLAGEEGRGAGLP